MLDYSRRQTIKLATSQPIIPLFRSDDRDSFCGETLFLHEVHQVEEERIGEFGRIDSLDQDVHGTHRRSPD